MTNSPPFDGHQAGGQAKAAPSRRRTPKPRGQTGGSWVEAVRSGVFLLQRAQVWHRGGPNQTNRVRYITQVTYGRRMVNTMYYPFMNYVMPEHVYKDASPRLKRLLGFLEHGPYG